MKNLLKIFTLLLVTVLVVSCCKEENKDLESTSIAKIVAVTPKFSKLKEALEITKWSIENTSNLAFQMPEAIMKNNSCRSLGYMRALGIWSIQYALDDIKSKKERLKIK